MFLFLLGGSLVLGTTLLAAASFSDGALLAFKTAAQVIGWLFVCAILLGSYARASRGEGLRGLRRASFGEISAATVTFLSGVAVLYLAYFEWGEIAPAPIPHAAAHYKWIDSPAPVITLAAAQFVTAVEQRSPVKKTAARIVPAQAPDACASFSGVESLQCRRCAEKSGVAWIICQESARLEYCGERKGDEATCPSAIPYSPPG
jgi:hypothetical protein